MIVVQCVVMIIEITIPNPSSTVTSKMATGTRQHRHGFHLKTLTLCILAWGIEITAASPPETLGPTERIIVEYFDKPNPSVLYLWPEGSPRNDSRNGKPEAAETSVQLRVTNTESPSLFVYPPPDDVPNTGAAMVFCPGGGYGKLAMSNPREFTDWMHPLGVTVATLKYHVPRSKNDPDHLWPLADAQRAMRVLRAHSERFGIDEDKIGIIGSSAGGHLAFNLCVNHDRRTYEPVDELDDQSCRPAFGMLFYPAYLTEKGTLQATPSLHVERINETTTPPLFVTLNGDDAFVHGSLRAMIELKKKKVPGELHMWAEGGHGGVFNKYPLAEHARPGIRFLVRHGILPQTSLESSDNWLNDTVATLNRNQSLPTRSDKPSASPPSALSGNELGPIDLDVQKRHGPPTRVYHLWPEGGARPDDPLIGVEETLRDRLLPGGSNVTVPTMTWFPANDSDGRTVLVFPGGGYNGLAYIHEGLDVCRWLNDQGINAFLVKYRTPRRTNFDKHHVALQDAQRAIRLVRSQASAFGTHPDAIGVLGFSAGGHLCALASTPQPNPSYEAIDSHDKVSPLADFGILIYPAYTTIEAETVDPLLLPKKVPMNPLFVATALDDKWTQGQFFFIHERVKAKQRIEYHIYEDGGHGKGMHEGKAFSFGQWPRECSRWLHDLRHEDGPVAKPES
ncbi:MAG: alpha/beta hydrolase [Planctomycetota bacterium]